MEFDVPHLARVTVPLLGEGPLFGEEPLAVVAEVLPLGTERSEDLIRGIDAL